MDGLEAGVGIVGIPIPGLIFRPNPGTGIDFWKPGSRPRSRFFYEIIFMKVVFSKRRLITRQIPGSKTGQDPGPSRCRPLVGGWSSHYCSETWNSETLENEADLEIFDILFKIDIQNGANASKIVHSLCQFGAFEAVKVRNNLIRSSLYYK